MSRTVGLGAWLATLSTAQLEELLRRRPDVAHPPEPRGIGELAARLSEYGSISMARARLSLSALQVGDALQLAGGCVGEPELLRVLGVDDAATAAQVRSALDELRASALVWPVGDNLRLAGYWRPHTAYALRFDREPDGYARFDPAPPPRPATAPVDLEQVRKGGSHAAGSALEAVRRLIALLERSPLATVQAGGVGARELRRAAKQISTDETGMRLWLETAAAAGLVALAPDPAAPEADRRQGRFRGRRWVVSDVRVALPTDAVDEWLAAEPTGAFTWLLLAWWWLPFIPTDRTDEFGKPEPALRRVYDRGGRGLRADTIGALTAIRPDHGLVENSELAEVLSYRAYELYRGWDVPAMVRTMLAEAELMGVVAEGALTPIGTALLHAVRTDAPADTLRSALDGLLPSASRTATFLPDLTAVVSGRPEASLARLLDEAADAESRDTASIWRFSTASIRRVLDAGRTCDDLLAALAAAAENPLPQPLEYLIRDVARRHGQVQVFDVASCVRVADPALAAELAADRTLASLRLRPLAGNLLASALPTSETVAALRTAGYAPVQQDDNGETVVERPPRRRVPQKRSATPVSGVPSHLAGLAARLA
jgi:hypothetical protein